MHPYRSFPFRVAALVLACAAGTAFADDDPVASALPVGEPALQPPQASVDMPAPAPENPLEASTSILGGSTPVDVERLAAMRGGDDTNVSNTSVDGSVHDNTADHVASGSNFISDDAFSGASGINTVIQNSGSNVLVQSGMSIQVIFTNPGQ